VDGVDRVDLNGVPGASTSMTFGKAASFEHSFLEIGNGGMMSSLSSPKHFHTVLSHAEILGAPFGITKVPAHFKVV